jgi:hypothetical protein
MKYGFMQPARTTAIGVVMLVGLIGAAVARDPGLGVGAPGVGVRDPGINQPGMAGNVGVGAPGVGVTPGVGIGAPGVGVVDPGLNQPGMVGNVGGVARRSVRR